MYKVFKKLFVIAMITILAATFFTSSRALAQETSPKYFCHAWANDPKRSGSNSVIGKGGASCTTTMDEIYVVVQLEDNVNGVAWANNTCHNTTSCSATATLPYYSGRTYQTSASGYVGNLWNGYYETNFVTPRR